MGLLAESIRSYFQGPYNSSDPALARLFGSGPTTSGISVTEDTGIDEAARLLIGERIRRVPVIRGGKMVGLLSRSDVLEFFAKTRWTCDVCGWWERSLEKPERCHSCSSTNLHLERADPGH